MTGAEYAKALFDLTKDEEEQSVLFADKMFKEYSDYKQLFDGGGFSSKESDELIEQAFGNTLTSAVIKIMARKRQLYLWDDFVAEMKALLDLYRNVLRVRVTTAVPLSHELQQRLQTAMEKRTGKKVVLTIEIDRAVIGGICIEAEGIYWDGTILEQLQQMQSALKGERA